MPDADAAPPAANPPSTPQSSPITDKDRVGEELADDARIWRIYDQVARADDKDRIDTWNRGLDNLALFAGLFSAVTTAFIIEAQKDMKVDYSQLTFLALNATANGVPFIQQPFDISSSARTITCLWVASLILSLSAALIAIMGKDWIGMYAARPACNARQWTEMRTYRLLCVQHWYMSEVIASAPVLLHLALLLFGTGLVLFISSDPLTHHLTLGLALVAGGLYLITALSAIVFPASPFKSPATQMIREALAASLCSACNLFSSHWKRNLIPSVHMAISEIIAPDLNTISHGQRSILPIFLCHDTNLLTQEGLRRRSLLRRAPEFIYTAPLSAWVVSRSTLIDVSRQMHAANIASAAHRICICTYTAPRSAWVVSRDVLIGLIREWNAELVLSDLNIHFGDISAVHGAQAARATPREPSPASPHQSDDGESIDWESPGSSSEEYPSEDDEDVHLLDAADMVDADDLPDDDLVSPVGLDGDASPPIFPSSPSKLDGAVRTPSRRTRAFSPSAIDISSDDDEDAAAGPSGENGRVAGSFSCAGDDVLRIASRTRWLSGSGLAVFAESQLLAANDPRIGHLPSTLLVDVQEYREAQRLGDSDKALANMEWIAKKLQRVPPPSASKKWLIAAHITVPQHWTLVEVRWDLRQLRFYDSMGETEAYALEVKDRCFTLLTLCEGHYKTKLDLDKWTWVDEQRGVRQNNWYDCGAFIAADFVSLLKSDEPSTLREKDMRSWRSKMATHMRQLPVYKPRKRAPLTARQMKEAIVLSD